MDLADGKLDGAYFGTNLRTQEERDQIRHDREQRNLQREESQTLSAMERLDAADGKMDGAYFGDKIGDGHHSGHHGGHHSGHHGGVPKDLHAVRVTVHGGKVKDADFIGKSDPYVVLTLDGADFRTATKDNTLTPQWDQTWEFQVKSQNPVLEVKAFDADPGARTPSTLCALAFVPHQKFYATSWESLQKL